MSSTKLPTFINKAKLQAEEIFAQAKAYFMTQYAQSNKVFSISSAYGQLLHALSQISNMQMFYLEDAVTELNIYSASRDTSIQGLARLAGHSITRSISATGEVEINLVKNPVDVTGNQILIPKYSKLNCVNNNLIYLLDIPEQEIRIPFGSTDAVYAKVIQGEIQNQTYTSNGFALQSYSVQERAYNFIDNFFVHVYVNGKLWKNYDSLYDIPKDYEGYVSKTGIAGGLDIYFGNSNFGKIPATGSEIRVEYLKSTGMNGNITEGDNVYFTWIDTGYSAYGESINMNDITVTKMSKIISFGANSENIELTRLIAPKTSRSYVFANPDNFVVFLQKFNYFSVIDAYTTFNDEYLDDDNIIYLYLIPDITKRLKQTENYFTVSQSYFTLTDTEKEKVLNLIEDSKSKIVTTVVKIVDPVIKKYVMNVSLVTFEGYSTLAIRANIISVVSDYFLSSKRRDRIPKSDIIRLLENVEGIDSVNVSFVSELNEARYDKTSPFVGLDEFGDIILEKDDLPLIRGGWTDGNSLYYNDSVDASKPCSINIEFKKTTKRIIS